jgi:hypothetical protein
MRLASRTVDFWELRSAEESHAQHPDTFWIPSREERENLQRGQAARLIFDIESIDDAGQVQLQGERMWVVVSERCGGLYVGILDNQPASVEPGEKVYLYFGAEVPFGPEHVIDIGDPPAEYVEWQLGQQPERRWPRE